MTDHLTFNALRQANLQRVGVFKNSKGERAHSKDDGSDWPPAMWLLATFGELGEYATERMEYESGYKRGSYYETVAAKELADFTIYSDILALHALNVVRNLGNEPVTVPEIFQTLIAQLGQFANAYKKYVRGDIDKAKFREQMGWLNDANKALAMLVVACNSPDVKLLQTVVGVVPSGVDLGQAVRDKFNEVSDRINVEIKI